MNREHDQHRYEKYSGYQAKQYERYRQDLPDNYGNRNRNRDFDSQGNDMGSNFPRRESRQDIYGTYSTSMNYGNMGSYGGAQGFGDMRGGTPSQRHYDSDTHYNFDSGMGSPQHAREEGYTPGGHRTYGYQSDYDSHGMGSSSNRNARREMHGPDETRRFQSSQQDHYNSNRDEYRSPNYGGPRGYMSSGYDRTTRGESQGDYGSLGRYESNRYDEPYGMSGYYRGGYGPSSYGEHFDRDARDFQRY